MDNVDEDMVNGIRYSQVITDGLFSLMQRKKSGRKTNLQLIPKSI